MGLMEDNLGMQEEFSLSVRSEDSLSQGSEENIQNRQQINSGFMSAQARVHGQVAYCSIDSRVQKLSGRLPYLSQIIKIKSS